MRVSSNGIRGMFDGYGSSPFGLFDEYDSDSSGVRINFNVHENVRELLPFSPGVVIDGSRCVRFVSYKKW